MRASRIMKLVAQVSSSSSRQVAPSSSASTMLAAWLVLPLASGERKQAVSLPDQEHAGMQAQPFHASCQQPPGMLGPTLMHMSSLHLAQIVKSIDTHA